MFIDKDWKYGSLEETSQFVTPEPGNRFLKITEAQLDESVPESPVYRIVYSDIQNGASIRASYYIMTKTGKINFRSREALLGLGRALAGPDYNKVPSPDKAVGGVVIGEVSTRTYVKKDGSEGTAYDVNNIFPAPQDFVEEFSDIMQYFEGCDDCDVEVEGASEGEE